MLACLAPALAGCATYRPTEGDAGGPATIIYVIGRGWHTDIGLPADVLTGGLGALRQSFPGVRYMTFGFGERAWLAHRRHDFADVLATVLPGPGALLATALRVSPEAAFGAAHVVRLTVRGQGMGRLTGFLSAYIGKDANGRPLRLADGPYPGSAFYASTGVYDLTHTCNTWTAEALRAAGLPVSPAGVLFASQVMARSRRAAARADP